MEILDYFKAIGRRFWVLQARPITQLPEPPGPMIEWSRTNYRELYPASLAAAAIAGAALWLLL